MDGFLIVKTALEDAISIGKFKKTIILNSLYS